MTSTRAIDAAAHVVHAAIRQGKTIPASIAYALDSAGLLNSPEHAAEVEQLRNDLTGACLARWEEEQDSARARFAAKLARQRAAKLRTERDAWHDWADALAYKVAPVEVLGRHGEEGRFPWSDALDLITPAAEVEQLRAQVADWEGTRRALALILKHGDMSDTVRQEIAQLISDEPDVDGAGRTYESYYPAAERSVDEDPNAYSLTVEALHASSGAVIETPSRREQFIPKLRGILARQQAAVEAAHETPPRPRPVPHDLPEVTQ